MQTSQPMQPPYAAPPVPSSGGSGLGKMLGPIALVLAVVAMAVNFVVPGPQGSSGIDGTDGINGTNGTNGLPGATGPRGFPGAAGANGTDGTNGTDGATGPPGPAGPGTLANYSVVAPWQAGGLALVGCSNVMTVDLTVPSAGYVVVIATVHVWVEHLAGNTDTWTIFESSAGAADCSDTDPTRNVFFQEISNSLAADTFMNEAGSVVNTFSVGGAGTYSFYVNSMMYTGETAGDRVSEASCVVIFYPA